METTEKRKEKEQFFEDLSRLDHFSDDSVDESPTFTFKRAQSSPGQINKAPEQVVEVQTTAVISMRNGASAKRRIQVEDESASLFTPRTADTSSERIMPAESPVRRTKKAKAAKPRRSKSDFDKNDPLRRNTDLALQPVPEDRQMFKDFVFCKYHIRNSLQDQHSHGVSLRAQWRRQVDR